VIDEAAPVLSVWEMIGEGVVLINSSPMINATTQKLQKKQPLQAKATRDFQQLH